MEVLEIKQVETQEDLTKAVEYYRAIQDEISRLQVSKDIAKNSIIEKFRETGMRRYDTPSGLSAQTYTRKGAEHIDVKEARTLLNDDTFAKLLRVGETIVVLSVTLNKKEKA